LIRKSLIVLEQAQEFEDPSAAISRGVRSRLCHVGKSQTNNRR
jgi:hypothetical protein